MRTPTPSDFLDREGRRWLIRSLTPADAPALLALDQQLVEDGRGMVIDPDELASDPDEHWSRQAPATDAERGRLLGAWSDHVLAGTTAIWRLRPRRLRHVATLTMGIGPQWQGRGLGRALLAEVLRWADAGGVLRTELAVRADNHRAVALYRSVGFELDYTRADFLRTDDGWVDDHQMSRTIRS